MSTVRGYGRHLGMVGTGSRLADDPGIYPSDPAAAILNDWTWQAGPPQVVQIPYAWLSGVQALRARPDKPLTSASVTQTSGITGRDRNGASLAAYGDAVFTATLDTALAEDATSLARHVVLFYATDPSEVPRTRFPSLLLRLNGRTEPEKQRILGVRIGQRIEITDPPATWPNGAAHQVVEGIHHSASDARDVEWNTAPVIGDSPGVSGPWFYFDSSVLDGTDLIPF